MPERPRPRPTTTGTGEVRYYKRDFWSDENAKYVPPHYRMEKCAKIANRIAGRGPCDLLDIGCGPATLGRLLAPNVNYHGIDIAIHEPAPNLLEVDIVQAPIAFDGKRFDIVVAQGVFEYLGAYQSQKFSEIAALLKQSGTFLCSYVNFGHRKPQIYWPYNNVQSPKAFKESLSQYFVIRRSFPTSLNWGHSEPRRKAVKFANMHFNLNVPILTPWLAVEYFSVCSARGGER